MWSTTANCNKKAALALGVMCFNTHAALKIDDVVSPHRSSSFISNVSGIHWSNIGTPSLPKSDKIELQSISDIVDFIKVTLGLPSKDIANILGVSRQTLYSYKSSLDSQTVNNTTMERALKLFAILQKTTPLFQRSPGAMAKNYFQDGKSLLDLLVEKELDTKSILAISKILSNKMSSATKATPNNEVSLYQLTTVS